MTSKVIDVEVDIGLYYGCMPPIVVPISDRAKAKIGMTDFHDGVIFLDADPVEVMIAISEDSWVLVELDELPSGAEVIKLMSIKVLH